MEAIEYFLLNTFTGEGVNGNPTPICILENHAELQKMESLARQFNCPVTVFLKKENGSDVYQIRYFTGTGEIPACGHGTLGAAHILFGKLPNSGPIVFRTMENMVLIASKENGTTFIQYPKLEIFKIAPLPKVNEALGIKEFKSYFICKELESLFIELEEENQVRETVPNYESLLLSTNTIKEVVVMSRANDRAYDFTLRSFCPWIGINEDPVTGSIHSALGHFWRDRLGKKLLIVHQASKSGGKLVVRPFDGSVKIGGDCEILEERVLIH